jgi:hypothetical protein
MLRAAGLTISALTNRLLEPSEEQPATGDPIEDRKTAFQHHVREYFTLARNIQSSLEDEAKALQESDLIPAKRALPRTGDSDDQLDNEGLGRFDIGTLNARTHDVAKRKEAEVWKEVREMLESKDAHDGNTVMNGHEAGQPNGANGR